MAKQALGEVTWTAEMVDTFVTLCGKLNDVCILTIPTMSDQFQLQMDASGLGLGGVRAQRGSGWKRDARGTLAVVAAIHHFLSYLVWETFQCCN